MKTSAALLLVLMLSACAELGLTKSDNRELTRIDCSGAAGWAVCYKQADTRCPSGFDIMQKEENLITGLRSISIACKK